MRTEIKSLQKKLGVTTVLVTHDQIEATTMANRIICLRAGRIEQIGPPDDLYRRPQSLFIAGFIGSPPINMISGEARDGVMCAGSVAFPFEGAPGAVTVGLRPEHLTFTGSGLSGRVAQFEPMGRENLYCGPCRRRTRQDRLLARGFAGVRRDNRAAGRRFAGRSADMINDDPLAGSIVGYAATGCLCPRSHCVRKPNDKSVPVRHPHLG